MDAQVDEVGIRINSAIQKTCESLAAGVYEELKSFKENASGLASHKNYENLQQQNKSTLESCELLRKENVLLQGQLKDLLAKHTSKKTHSTPAPVSSPETSDKTSDSRQISRETQRLIDENPELRAILDRQATEYRKLQTAHGVLLGKLKEHQEVIIQLQRERTNPLQSEESEEAHLARLKDVINPPQHDLALLHTSPTRKIGHASSNATAESSRFQPFKKPASKLATKSTDNVISGDHGRGEDVMIQDPEPVSIPTVLVDIPTEPTGYPNPTMNGDVTINDNSQPVFVSERPVKRRRTGNANRLQPRIIKMESSLAQGDDLEEYHSLDLDAIATPIIMSDARPTESRSFPRATSANTSVTQTAVMGRFSAPPLSVESARSVSHLETSERSETSSNPSILPETIIIPSRSSSAEAVVQDKPRRTVLQIKTPNMKVGKSTREAKRQSILSHEKYTPEVTRIHESENMAPVAPVTPSVQTSLSANRESDQGISGKKNSINQIAAGKYATPLQRKRDQLESRLRNKHINELSVNDFVLNPAMNEGFRQALGALDISKPRRQCLPDCSKADCCGAAFAAALQNSGITSLQGSSFERDEDLRSYLGFSVASLGRLSEQEHQRLLDGAIGKQFAQKCIRQKHYRAESPPGYWRAEFPTTQEREVDRQQAEQSERTVLEQRRKEALRNGGLWMFRDEV